MHDLKHHVLVIWKTLLTDLYRFSQMLIKFIQNHEVTLLLLLSEVIRKLWAWGSG